MRKFSGTKRQDEYLCPLGTFGNDTGYNSSSDCSPCSGGYYCGQLGLTFPSGQCEAGFYCRQYAERSAPNQTLDANLCPQGTKFSTAYINICLFCFLG